MSEQQIQETPTGVVVEVAERLASMKLCHVCPFDSETPYCGAGGGTVGACDDYDGEAICPTCGRPTCPRCAQLCDLDDRLEDAL